MAATHLLLLMAVTSLVVCDIGENQVPQPPKSSKSKPPTQLQTIKSAQLVKKQSAQLYKGASEQYNFKIEKYTDLIVTPQTDEEIVITVDILWRQRDLYLLAPVQKSEVIRLYVQQINKGIIYNDSFYTMTGVRFKATARASYKIYFTEAGKQQKMALLKISQKLIAPKSAAKKETMQKSQKNLAFALGKLQNALLYSKTGQMLDHQISSYVLRQSLVYTYFQVVQALIVVLISIFQVIFVTGLLKGDSIV